MALGLTVLGENPSRDSRIPQNKRDSLRFAIADFARQIRQGVGSAEHLESEILVAVEAGVIDAQVGAALAREAEEIAETLAAVQRRVGHATPNGASPRDPR